MSGDMGGGGGAEVEVEEEDVKGKNSARVKNENEGGGGGVREDGMQEGTGGKSMENGGGGATRASAGGVPGETCEAAERQDVEMVVPNEEVEEVAHAVRSVGDNGNGGTGRGDTRGGDDKVKENGSDENAKRANGCVEGGGGGERGGKRMRRTTGEEDAARYWSSRAQWEANEYRRLSSMAETSGTGGWNSWLGSETAAAKTAMPIMNEGNGNGAVESEAAAAKATRETADAASSGDGVASIGDRMRVHAMLYESELRRLKLYELKREKMAMERHRHRQMVHLRQLQQLQHYQLLMMQQHQQQQQQQQQQQLPMPRTASGTSLPAGASAAVNAALARHNSAKSLTNGGGGSVVANGNAYYANAWSEIQTLASIQRQETRALRQMSETIEEAIRCERKRCVDSGTKPAGNATTANDAAAAAAAAAAAGVQAGDSERGSGGSGEYQPIVSVSAGISCGIGSIEDAMRDDAVFYPLDITASDVSRLKAEGEFDKRYLAPIEQREAELILKPKSHRGARELSGLLSDVIPKSSSYRQLASASAGFGTDTKLRGTSPSKSAAFNEAEYTSQQGMAKVLTQLKDQGEASEPFLKKVSKSPKFAPGYYDMIKEPMDLGTMTKKLKAHQYRSKAMFEYDLNLIFTNCRIYNRPHTKYVKFANQLEEISTQLLAALPDFDFDQEAKEEEQNANGNGDVAKQEDKDGADAGGEANGTQTATDGHRSEGGDGGGAEPAMNGNKMTTTNGDADAVTGASSPGPMDVDGGGAAPMDSAKTHANGNARTSNGRRAQTGASTQSIDDEPTCSNGKAGPDGKLEGGSEKKASVDAAATVYDDGVTDCNAMPLDLQVEGATIPATYQGFECERIWREKTLDARMEQEALKMLDRSKALPEQTALMRTPEGMASFLEAITHSVDQRPPPAVSGSMKAAAASSAAASTSSEPSPGPARPFFPESFSTDAVPLCPPRLPQSPWAPMSTVLPPTPGGSGGPRTTVSLDSSDRVIGDHPYGIGGGNRARAPVTAASGSSLSLASCSRAVDSAIKQLLKRLGFDSVQQSSMDALVEIIERRFHQYACLVTHVEHTEGQQLTSAGRAQLLLLASQGFGDSKPRTNNLKTFVQTMKQNTRKELESLRNSAAAKWKEAAAGALHASPASAPAPAHTYAPASAPALFNNGSTANIPAAAAAGAAAAAAAAASGGAVAATAPFV